MALTDLLAVDRIVIDLPSCSKDEILAKLVELLDRAGKLADAGAFLDAVREREKTGSTGLEQGVAVPHARSDTVREPALAFAIVPEGVDFGALDGHPSHFFLMIAEPADVDSTHLNLLAAAASHLVDPAFREQLLRASSAQAVLQCFADAEGVQLPPAAEAPEEGEIHLVAVTACPVGIAHTFMAAERLREAARELHLHLRVETQGADGVREPLSDDEIRRADAVILAVDRDVDLDRFADKPVLLVPAGEAIQHPQRVLLMALRLPETEGAQRDEPAAPSLMTTGKMAIYRHLMAGVSGMLPFVVGGGILIALSFTFGIDATDPDSPYYHPMAALLAKLGGPQGAFGLMVPVFAAFIGRSIAGRLGLMPAMVGGYIATQAGTGFLGGLVAGLIGGYGILFLQRLFRRLPESLDAMRVILIYPVAGLLLCGSLMYWLSEPMVAINNALAQWLAGLHTGNRVVLGVLLGGMMAVDMGGPVNKAAYTFGIAAIEAGNYLPPAATMAGGMVPPLGLGLATLLFPRVFNTLERQSGRTCLIMGASYITEAAIPYAAADPLRVIPSCIAGSMLAGALSMAFGCELISPHGGVFVIPLVQHWPGYLVALLAGSVLTAVLVGLLKRFRPPSPEVS